MDDTISYNVVFNIDNESIVSNATCIDCQYGYCICGESANITMENVIAALCYSSTPTLRDMYNYTWEDFWTDDIDVDHVCISDAETLLYNNYIIVQQFETVSAPAFYVNSQSIPNIIPVSSFLRIIDNSKTFSNCDLYLELYDVIYPICDSLNTTGVQPTLCQATNCYSWYCHTTQASLVITDNKTNSYQILDYEPYRFDGIVGSPLLNIKHTAAILYGFDEYVSPSLGCFNGGQVTEEMIDNTIPILAVNLSACKYIDLITTFQDFGARAVVMVTDIVENSEVPTPSKTPNTSESPLNYDQWLPFNCHIQFLPSITNYTAIFLSVVSDIDAEIATVFETNIRRNESDAVSGLDSLLYQFDVNTTYNYLSDIPDTLISYYLTTYLELRLFLDIESVKCYHGLEINESFSNSPSHEPTNNPTTSPTHRSIEYDDIYIPIELVRLEDMATFAQFVNNSEGLEIGFLCNTDAPTNTPSYHPTTDPTINPTMSPTINPTSNPTLQSVDNNETNEFVIFTYKNGQGAQLSMGITFPTLSLESFIYVYDQICNFPVDHNIVTHNQEYGYYVTVDTIWTEFDTICAQFNDDTNILITGWEFEETADDDSSHWITTTTDSTAENGCTSNMQNSSTNIGTQQHGTYCIAIYSNIDMISGNKWYNLRIRQLFSWTPSFVSIQGSQFINNTVTEGKGGAITIAADEDIYEFLSIFINDTSFDSNYAASGGGAIYRGWSQSTYSANYIQMSVLEMKNIQFHNNVAQNTNGGSIMTELFATETDGLIFRNTISITNMILTISTTSTIQSGSKSDGFGGGISTQHTNLYINNSDISNGYAWDGGCIWMKDTALTLYDSDIRNCSASNDGGGLKAEFTAYPLYDLCLAVYYTDFSQNHASNDGGGVYLKLLGGPRQSCVKLFDVIFVDNEIDAGKGDSIHLLVQNGPNDILNGDTPFSVICEESECIGASSILNSLCASDDVTECQKYGRLSQSNYSIIKQYVSNVNIVGVTGESITFYVTGWDAFGNSLNTSEYNILVQSDKASSINPEGTGIGDTYVVSMIINVGENNGVGFITISDQNGVAESLNIKLETQQCNNGFYQKENEIDSSLFSCDYCDNNRYTMKIGPCKSCETGLICYGGNNVFVEENWYAQQGTNDDEYTLHQDSYLVTTLCAPQYCCTNFSGCNFSKSDELCAYGRDSSVRMCG